MPDLFAPALVLALALLGCARDALSRGEALYLGLLSAIGVAAHLAHLPLALALLLPALVFGGLRGALRVAVPLAVAVLLLLGTNWAGHGRAALSPHGATFMLARLQADGPAAAVIRARCPAAGWYLCTFAERLPMDANDFLWASDSPVNRDAEGRARFLGGAQISAEAGAIVAETIRAHPVAVVEAMLRNTFRQLVTAGIGDTLGPDHLAAALRPRIAEAFPAGELAAYDAALQPRGLLREALPPLAPLHAALLLVGLPLLLLGAVRSGDRTAIALAAAIAIGLLANAAATGGLSGVFPRYQARIAWLLPVGALLLLLPRRRAA